MNKAYKNVLVIIILLITASSIFLSIYTIINSTTNAQNIALESFDYIPDADFIQLTIESLSFSFVMVYIIKTKFNNIPLKNSTNNIFKIGEAVLTAIIISQGILLVSNCYIKKEFAEYKQEKNITNSIEITNSDINLNGYRTNISITRGGYYAVTGVFTNSIIIDTNEEVTLLLNDATIQSKLGAAIINKNKAKLTIKTIDETESSLSSQQNDEKAVIYSNGDLTFTGGGSLNISNSAKSNSIFNLEDANLTIENGLYKLISETTIINQSGNTGIFINGGNTYLESNYESINTNTKIQINDGTLYILNNIKNKSAKEQTYEINGGIFILLNNISNIKISEQSVQKSLYLNLEKRIYINSIISIIDQYNNDLLSFKLKYTTSRLIISSKTIKTNLIHILKDTQNNGAIINYVYYNSSSTGGEPLLDNVYLNEQINKISTINAEIE